MGSTKKVIFVLFDKIQSDKKHENQNNEAKHIDKQLNLDGILHQNEGK